MADFGGPVAHGLAQELDAARGVLEALATALCLDPLVFERHGAALQEFDRLGQVIGEVAGVLRHSGPVNDALAGVRLEAVKDRLHAAI
ncbi:hypothetical protein ACLN6N_13180 [Sphingomonas carotinifaciens]|uniref:hypothetical protein n=1 Tax=Sphingomonas carotinifaciens TaxID=1166323 RepID=UPI0039A23B5C